MKKCTFSDGSSNDIIKQKQDASKIIKHIYSNSDKSRYRHSLNKSYELRKNNTISRISIREEWSTESEIIEDKCIQTEIESSCEEECRKRKKKKKNPSRFQSIVDLAEEKCRCTNKEYLKKDLKTLCEQKYPPKSTSITNTQCCREKSITPFKRPKSKKNKLNYRVDLCKDKCNTKKKNFSMYDVSNSSDTSYDPQVKPHINEKPNVEGACMTFPLFLLTMISNLVGVD